MVPSLTFFAVAGVIFLVVMWLALAFWVYRDARQRLTNGGAVNGFTALAVLIPFLGPLVYLVVRPPDLLTDARERQLGLEELERKAYGARFYERTT